MDAEGAPSHPRSNTAWEIPSEAPIVSRIMTAPCTELRNDVAREQYRWITVGSPSQPAVAIVLTNHVNGSPADVDAIAGLVAKGAVNGVHFHTDHLDGTFERLVTSGAEIVSEPTEQPWGARDCAVRDPSGNLLRIDQPPAGRR